VRVAICFRIKSNFASFQPWTGQSKLHYSQRPQSEGRRAVIAPITPLCSKRASEIEERQQNAEKWQSSSVQLLNERSQVQLIIARDDTLGMPTLSVASA